MMRPVDATALTCENAQACCKLNFDTVSEQHMPASLIVTSLLRVFILSGNRNQSHVLPEC
jgi:hypothetical protein